MTRKILAVLWLALVSAASVAAPRIERVEPSSWWVGMKDDRLQLLVHGERVASLEPVIRHPGVTLAGIDKVRNPNYLFLNLAPSGSSSATDAGLPRPTPTRCTRASPARRNDGASARRT
jgi:Cyclomaltodextrinase, N-terminal